MAAEPTPHDPPDLDALRTRFDGALGSFLARVRAEMAPLAPDALLPIEEVIRLVGAGGKRLRPAFCYWGYRAAGGVDGEQIERAAAALELLHTMALIHDDLMDRSPERRGAPSSAIQLTEQARRRGSPDPERAGASLALLAGDLAAVLADRLLLESGFPPDRLVGALDRYHRMRIDMALGQGMDVAGGDREPRRRGGAQGRVLHGRGAAADRRGARRRRRVRHGVARRVRSAARTGVPAPGRRTRRRRDARAGAGGDPRRASPSRVGGARPRPRRGRALSALADLVAAG